jgi:signal transduction histidine kinase
VQTLRFHRQQNNVSQVDLAELMRSIVSLYAGRFLVREIGVQWKVADTPKLSCLEGEIRQVLNNLIRNAIDAMPQGGKLFVRLRTACGPDDRVGVRITVADSGEGISPGIMNHLFEPFYTTKDVTGTGLGLWVSKGIVDKHGGSVTVRTRVAGASGSSGTVFAIWLPLNSSTWAGPDEA